MIPDYLEAITAYRCWDVHPNGLLIGQAVSEPWPPFLPMESRCATTDGVYGADSSKAQAHIVKGEWQAAPVFSCDCGIHAYRTLEDAEKRIISDPNPEWGRPLHRVWGALKLWGKLIVHEQGYRAQFAYPSALFCEDAGLSVIVGRLYGVACEHKAMKRPKSLSDEGSGLRYTSSWYTFTPPSPQLIVAPPIPKIKSPAPPALVGANRWQTRQYGKVLTPPSPSLADWRDVLKLMVYKHAP